MLKLRFVRPRLFSPLLTNNLSSSFSFSPKQTISFALRSPMGSFTTSSPSSLKFLFHQLFEKESSTYTYLLADFSHPDKPALVSLFFFFLSLYLCFSHENKNLVLFVFGFLIVLYLIWWNGCAVDWPCRQDSW